MSGNREAIYKTGSRNRFRLISTMMVLGFLALQSGGLFAQGNLLITPRRVVFDGSRRSVDLNLANSGQDSATYAISLVQIRMTETGGFETITEPDPGQRFADGFVRFFPRSVTLAPNEAQVIKIEVTRRSQLEEGEYRSHLYFRAVPKAKPLGEEDPAVEEGSISVKLTPVFGITIPVIIQMGESTTGVTLSDLKLNITGDKDPNLEMTFNRSGNMSVYGDLTVDHVSPSGEITRVGIANGVAVYTPNTIRKFNLNLVSEKKVDFTSGILKVYFSAPSDVGKARYAEAELNLR
ncbi:MAG: hypothetical protein R6W31_05830 [Bacteroidales bacterium]